MTRTWAWLVVAAALAAMPSLSGAAEVRGVVFDDRNGDGSAGAGEAPLAGWIVYADADDDGVLDNASGPGTCTGQATERCAVSDSSGFRLADLPAGAVRLRLVSRAGWARTTDAAIDLVLEADDVVGDLAFGVLRLGVASGVVFEDANGDGGRDDGERPLSGFAAYADENLDALLSPGEPQALSDASGAFAVDDLAFGVHALRLQSRCGFAQTLPPPPGRYVLSITTGGQVIANRDFGLRPPAVLPGDGNGDGVVTAADLVAVARAIGSAPLYGSDADGDGVVTAADVAATASNAFGCADLRILVGAATATPTATETATSVGPSATATATPPPPTSTATGAATATATIVSTATATVASTATATVGASATATVVSTTTATVAASATVTSVATATVTRTPNATATSTSTVQATATRTAASTATSTPPPTSTLTRTPTATAIAGPDAAALAGTAVQIANGMNAIPAVITALVSGLRFGSGALVFDPAAQTSGIGGTAGACPLGGSATSTCSNGASSVAFNNCRVPTASGSAVIEELPPADPAVTLHGGTCFQGFPFPPWTAAIGISANFRDPQNGPLLTATAALTGTIAPAVAIGSSCNVSGATLTVSGTVRTQFGDGSSTSIGFTNTAINVAVQAFNAQCVPLRYTMTVNGPGTVTVAPPPALVFGAAAETSTAVTFTNFVVSQNATNSPTLTELDGGLGTACAGAPLAFDTVEPLAQVVGAQCPIDGTLRVSAGAATTQLFYLAGGAVDLDANNDGIAESRLASCSEAPLLCEGGGATPTATPFASATATRTATAVPTSTLSATPTPTAIPTATNTPPPGSTATATPSRAATPSQTLTPAPATATVTPPPTATRSVTATPSPTGTPEADMFCDTLSQPALIPDASAAGINNTITVQSGQTITDLNVSLRITHTWPGDLRVTLTHVDTGTVITLLDRPGAPATTNGCGLDDPDPVDDVDAVFDDSSLRPAESRCAAGPPLSAAIDGSVRPNELLAAFNGQSLAGTWRLNVADLATQDTGSLLGWCLLPNSHAPVVRDFTCGVGETDCVVVVDDPFSLSFGYVDSDGDAATWKIDARREDGYEFNAGGGGLQSGASGSGTINFDPFTCPSLDCDDTVFDYTLVVTDAAGHTSPPQRLRLTVTLFGL